MYPIEAYEAIKTASGKGHPKKVVEPEPNIYHQKKQPEAPIEPTPNAGLEKYGQETDNYIENDDRR